MLREVSPAEELRGPRGEFLGTLAHELRSTLGLIRVYAATLLAPDAPRDEATLRRCLSAVVDASADVEELLNQVLDLSKATLGALDIEPRPVRLTPLVRTAIGRARIRTPRHTLLLDLPAQLPPVLADARRLGQVLGNLLDNAIKYSPAGGQITLSAQPNGDEVIVRVSDGGLGVSAEELGKCFDQFYRGTTARTSQIPGDGLGLAICKGIVEAHGGRIWAQSPATGLPAGAGPGTTVHFTLPIAAAARPATRELHGLLIAALLVIGQCAGVADIADGDGVGAETQRIEWLINPDRGNPARPGVRDGRWYRGRYRGRRLTCGQLVES
jgi:signal transduction histidine kinase